MTDDKLFFKYQSLKQATGRDGAILKDENGNGIIYSVKNLANNQLYFNNPTKFDDPFDCKFNVVEVATREQWIIFYMAIGCNEEIATMHFNHNKENSVYSGYGRNSFKHRIK